MCGAGVVGGGVLDILANLKNSPFRVTKVLVRDTNKERGFALPPSASYTTDWQECVRDVDMVIELVGGTAIAKDIVFAALQNNIHVVTANKALIAAYLTALEEILVMFNLWKRVLLSFKNLQLWVHVLQLQTRKKPFFFLVAKKEKPQTNVTLP